MGGGGGGGVGGGGSGAIFHSISRKSLDTLQVPATLSALAKCLPVLDSLDMFTYVAAFRSHRVSLVYLELVYNDMSR